jgi:hypothetical protein
MRRLLLALFLVLPLPLSAAGPNGATLLSRAWPSPPAATVSEIGRGVGVVFSPDLSVEGNCRFYQSLGFACFEDADWHEVLDQLHRYNVLYPERRIGTLVLETHGTNGNGLKLQRSYAPDADRSYIAVGALQERLEVEGISYVIISACNSGRLLRPEIYTTLNRNPGDKLFLPPTRGIIDASPQFDPLRSRVTVITPGESHIETTLVGSIAELKPATRRAIAAAAKSRSIDPPKQFAISDMMVQMLLRDPRLALTTNQYVEEMSKKIQPVDESERLFTKFVKHLNAVAAKRNVTPKSLRAAARPRPVRAAAASAPRIR